ncbi:type IV secretory system conjugative DNA transfer family protein [Candidatus Giovannonibacteria bacterium]|nr:type IV secretory system conjugative DNA transfer family protein [Candidatus Giovannonibacteria bacterium]
MSSDYLLLTILFFAALPILLILYVFLRYKRINSISSSLSEQLFLVSLPENREEKNENPTEARKNFIAHMEKFLMGLSGLKSGTIFGEIFGKGNSFALELAAHNDGSEIFFYVAFPRKFAKLLESQIHGAYPDAKIEKVEDYNIFHPNGVSRGALLGLERNKFLPIKTYQKIESDPVETITSAFSKIKEFGEGAALQIVLRPAGKKLEKPIHKVIERLKEGKKRRDVLGEKNIAEHTIDVFKQQKKPKPEEKTNAPVYDEELVKLLEEKVSKITFDVNVRLIVSAENNEEVDRIMKEFEAGFYQFSIPEGNAFKIKNVFGAGLKKLTENFSFRFFDESEAMPMNVEEISSLYHFPYSKKAAPQVRMLKAREATPPVNMPREGVLLGNSSFRGELGNVYIKKDDRRRHFYIIGQTGTGKSALMHNMIAQDIKNGEGVAVIDPHGELIEKILGLIPQERAEDVIYFDPGDVQYPMGLNMLEYDPMRPEQKTMIVNELLEIFNKLFNMSVSGGPMFEQYFRNATLLVMEDPESGNTLLEIERVLADKAYRDYKLSRSKNIVVDTFWKQIAEKAGGEASLQNMVPYVVSKFDTFLANEIMRPIIAQEKSAFNVREAMDQKKILLLNLSKGRLGELNASLLGLIMVGKILMAALSRVDSAEEDRKDFYLYIDEFQNVTTKSIATILSEARKYKLNLTLVHQFIGQLDEDIKKAVFGNVGSICSFRIGSDDGEYMEKQFEPVFNSYDLLNIDNFNAYMKLLIDGQTSKPFNLKTIRPETGNPEMAQYIKQLSRSKYARPREEVEEEIRIRHAGASLINSG